MTVIIYSFDRKNGRNNGLKRNNSLASISQEDQSPNSSNRVILRSHTKNESRDIKNARQQV